MPSPRAGEPFALDQQYATLTRHHARQGSVGAVQLVAENPDGRDRGSGHYASVPFAARYARITT